MELSQEIDIGVEHSEPNGTILDDIAHPLMLYGFGVRGDQKVEVFN